MTSKRKARYGLALLAAIMVALLLFVWLSGDAATFIDYAVSGDTPPGLFLLMFALLPLVGFPISVFLILTGVKFGAWLGVLIMLAGMPVHLLVAYLVANSFMRTRVEALLAKMAYRLPQIPEKRILWFSVVFMAVPGLPYTVKNYVLPLAGAPFWYFFLSGYLVQGAMGVPFVVAGDAVAGKHLVILAVAVALMLALYAVVLQFRRRHGDLLKDDAIMTAKPSGNGPSGPHEEKPASK